MLANEVRPWLALTLWREESAPDPSLYVIAVRTASVFFEACGEST